MRFGRPAFGSLTHVFAGCRSDTGLEDILGSFTNSTRYWRSREVGNAKLRLFSTTEGIRRWKCRVICGDIYQCVQDQGERDQRWGAPDKYVSVRMTSGSLYHTTARYETNFSFPHTPSSRFELKSCSWCNLTAPHPYNTY